MAPVEVFAENIAQIQEFWGCGNVPYRRDKPMTSVLKPGEIRAVNLASMRKTDTNALANAGHKKVSMGHGVALAKGQAGN